MESKPIALESPLIELFIFTYNEANILPFIISSYRKSLVNVCFALIDNESNDGTMDLAMQLGCKVIVSKTGGKSNNTVRKNYRNNVWKESQCQWVGVIDADELVCITAEELITADFSIIRTVGYSMVNKHGESYAEMAWGFRDSAYDKLVIFDRTKIKGANYTAGGHQCRPVGEVKRSDKLFPLYHYHYISEDSLVRKYQERQARRSQEDARKGFSTHYFISESETRKKYQSCLSKCKIVIRNDFELTGLPAAKSTNGPYAAAVRSRADYLTAVLPTFATLVSRSRGATMSPMHYSVIACEFATLLEETPEKKVLVFGAGWDTELWNTVTLRRVAVAEHNAQWILRAEEAGAETIRVGYSSKSGRWMDPVELPKGLEIETRYLSVLVDAPQGAGHGREQSVFAASEIRRRHGASVFIHDYERPWERSVCDKYLGPPTQVLRVESDKRELAFWKSIGGIN